MKPFSSFLLSMVVLLAAAAARRQPAGRPVLSLLSQRALVLALPLRRHPSKPVGKRQKCRKDERSQQKAGGN